jgi:hypothetical protein
MPCTARIPDDHGNEAEISRVADGRFDPHLHCDAHDRDGVDSAVA